MKRKSICMILTLVILMSMMGIGFVQVNAAVNNVNDLWPEAEDLLVLCTKLSNGTNNDQGGSQYYMDPIKGCITLKPGEMSRYWGPICRTPVDYANGMTQLIKLKFIDDGSTDDDVYVFTIFPGLPADDNGVNDFGYGGVPGNFYIEGEFHENFMASFTAGELRDMQPDKDGFITVANVIKRENFYSKEGNQPDGQLDLRIDFGAPGAEGAERIQGILEIYSAAVYKGDKTHLQSPNGKEDLSVKGEEVKVELTNKDKWTCPDTTDIKSIFLQRSLLGDITSKSVVGLKDGSVITLKDKIDFNQGLLDVHFSTAGNKQGGWVITGDEGDSGAIWKAPGGKALTNKIEIIVNSKVVAIIYADGSMPNRLKNSYSGFSGNDDSSDLQYIPGPAIKTVVTNDGKLLKGQQEVSLKFYMDGMEVYPGDFSLIVSTEPIEVTPEEPENTDTVTEETHNQESTPPKRNTADRGQDSSSDKSDGGFPTGLVIGIIAAVVVVAGGIGFVVFKMKRKG